MSAPFASTALVGSGVIPDMVSPCPRVPIMLANAKKHSEASLGQAVGSDYAVEHWLACYAVLLLTAEPIRP